MYIGLHIKYPLFFSVCNETYISSKGFRKKKPPQISNFMTIRPVGAELCPMNTQERTDKHDDVHDRLSQFFERSYKV